jgi:FkbM family methyltransferase
MAPRKTTFDLDEVRTDSAGFLPKVVDYLQGFRAGFAGLTIIGPCWAWMLALYIVHPIVGRLWPGSTLSCGAFRVRLGYCDLHTVMNLFRDYDIPLLRRLLSTAELVIDAGANIGAFSYLIRSLHPTIPIIALEPEQANFQFLVSQPFATTVDCRQMAIGPRSGRARLLIGENSVSHRVVFADQGDVSISSLESLVAGKTILKLDIEGGERAVLSEGLPLKVVCVVMEWHYSETPGPLLPPGDLRLTLRTLYGLTTWSWVRTSPGSSDNA